MILTLQLNLNRVKMNHHVKLAGSKASNLKIINGTHRHLHMQTD